jgi:hypothetical protein
VIARAVLATVLAAVPAAQAADLAIRLVVVKSARVSVQGVQPISPQDVQVTVLPAGDGWMRVVFTP